MEQNFEKCNENCIEFLSGERYATVSFSNRKHVNRIKKLYEERGSEFKYFYENEDGTVCAKLPTKWIKISAGSKPGTRAKREYTEEEKKILAERLKKARESKVKDASKKK